MLKIGLDSFSLRLTLAGLPPREAVDLLLKRVLEYKLDGWQIDPMHLDNWDESLVKDVGQMSRDHGLYLELGSGGFEYDYLLPRLELAAKAGARCLRTFVSWERAAVGEERIREIVGFAIPHLQKLAEPARAHGVPIAIENHEDLTSAELQKLLDEVDSDHIGACVDNGNALSVGEDPVECVRRLASYTHACHLKDWRVRMQGGALERTSQPFGSGGGKVDEIFGILRCARPGMPLTIEQPFMDPRTPPAAADEDACVRQSVDYLRALTGVSP